VTLPGGGRFASETILHNVRVLAVDQALNQTSASQLKKKPKPVEPKSSDGAGPADEQAIVGKTVAIEATAEESERVLAAEAAGTLSLALRSMAISEAGDGSQAPFTRDVDMSRVLRMATGGGVKVIKGGEIVH
jgi:pilus assembly protein CpaB